MYKTKISLGSRKFWAEILGGTLGGTFGSWNFRRKFRVSELSGLGTFSRSLGSRNFRRKFRRNFRRNFRRRNFRRNFRVSELSAELSSRTFDVGSRDSEFTVCIFFLKLKLDFQNFGNVRINDQLMIYLIINLIIN